MLLRIYDYTHAGIAGNTALAIAALLLTAVFVYFVVVASLLWRIDCAYHRLPDKLVLPLYPGIGLPLLGAVLLAGDSAGPHRISYSAIALFGAYWALRKVSRNSLGLGDVKLAGALGLLLGYFSPMNLIWGTLLAFLLGGIYSLWLLSWRKANLKTHIPFGPFMLAGAFIATIFPA